MPKIGKMLNFLLFERIYVKKLGTSTQCLQNKPCDYSYGFKTAKPGDNIIILDEEIEKPKHLQWLRDLFKNCSRLGVSIDGSGIIVKGNDQMFPGNTFINIEKAKNIQIKNFVFSNFIQPVFSFKNSEIEIENMQFLSSNTKKKQISFNVIDSKIKFTSVKLHKCTSHDSPLFKFTNSNVEFDNLSISYNFVFHEFRMPVIYSIGSKIAIFNSKFENNNSPTAPFIQLESLSTLNISNTIFDSVSHSSLIHSYHNIKVSIENTSFINIHGSLYTSTSKDSLIMDDCQIINSASTTKPLIYTQRSTSVIKNCVFENNAGNSIIGSIANSNVEIIGCVFDSNKPEHSIILADIKSKAFVEICNFENSKSQEGVISATHNSAVSVSNSYFSKSWVKSINIVSSKGFITNSEFEQFSYYSDTVMSNYFGTLNVDNTTIKGSSINGVIENYGKSKLQRLNFDAGIEKSLPNNLHFVCKDCKFADSLILTKVDKSSIIVTFIAALIAGGIISSTKSYVIRFISSLYEINPNY